MLLYMCAPTSSFTRRVPTQEVDRAWEELTVAQATIQALQRRVSELSEGKSEEEVGRSFAEIEELRSKLRISESQLQSMQREMSELKKQLQLHSTGKLLCARACKKQKDAIFLCTHVRTESSFMQIDAQF